MASLIANTPIGLGITDSGARADRRDCGAHQRGGRGGEARPDRLPAALPGAALHRGEGRGIVEQAADRLGERGRAVRLDQLADPVRQQLAGVNIGRRHHGLAQRHGIAERARGRLLEVWIGRDEDVAGLEPVEQLLVIEEAVFPPDRVADAERAGPLHQHLAVTFALARGQHRMGGADDAVHQRRMPAQNRGKRVDDMLEPLAGAEQAERHQHRALADVLRGLGRGGAAERTIGRAMLDHVEPRGFGAVALDQQIARMAAHHHHPAGAREQMLKDPPLPLGRPRQHGVERQHQRRRQPIDEIADHGPVGTAEDAIFVLDPDRVRAARVDRLRRGAIGGGIVGAKRRHPRGIGAGGLALLERENLEADFGMVARGVLEHVGGEGGDSAVARRKGADQRDRERSRNRDVRLPAALVRSGEMENSRIEVHRRQCSRFMRRLPNA